MMRSLLVRLVVVSLGVAVVSIAATTWLITHTTGETVRGAFEQTLEADSFVYQRLLAYAQAHDTWDDVESTVSELSEEIGDRVALTTADGRVLADSADPKRPEADLPPTPTAEVDARAMGMVSVAGASVRMATPTAPVNIERSSALPALTSDMLGVPPTWRLTDAEVEAREEIADSTTACLVAAETPPEADENHGGSEGQHAAQTDCVQTELVEPSQAATDLNDRIVEELSACLDDEDIDYTIDEGPRGLPKVVPADDLLMATDTVLGYSFEPQESMTFRPSSSGTASGTATADDDSPQPTDPEVTDYLDCATEAKDVALGEVVADPALVYVGSHDRFDPLSGEGWGPVLTAGAGVLAVATAVTAVTGRRLTRPIRALTSAAQRMGSGDRAARVPERGHDEVADLGRAFNTMAESIESGERHRRAMVSDIAHELRTPLSNVRGYLEAAEDGVVAVDQDLVTSLREESDLLRHLVDDLQSLALADAGALRVHAVDTDAADLARQTVAAHRTAAADRDVSLSVEIPDRADDNLQVPVDPTRMRQALGNLIGNAIRYTPAGGTVVVSVTWSDAADPVTFTVADDGPGIPADHLERIFDRFHRVESSRSRDTGGSGLGLPIARSLVEAHGGTVDVTSTEGEGSTFTITLPSHRS